MIENHIECRDIYRGITSNCLKKSCLKFKGEFSKEEKKNLCLVKGSQIQNITNSHFLSYTSIQIHSSALL
jgi:hypothetical protein